MDLIYSQIKKKPNIKYIDSATTGYTLPLGIYEIIDNNSLLKSLFPDEVDLNILIDDIKLKSNITVHRSISFTERFFSIQYYVLLNLIQELWVILNVL